MTDSEIILGPWIADLVRQYRYQAATIIDRPSRIGLALTAFVAAGAALAPALLHLDHEAYPSDPEKQRALEACGRADPTFIRFFAGDRAACYERFSHIVTHGVVADQEQPGLSGPVAPDLPNSEQHLHKIP